ncbi:hypothetical protein AAVH_05890 [Aphelenchoides avenae]|nr:hypothetical protein AAVH_05890 [Aphelenchus avenae]
MSSIQQVPVEILLDVFRANDPVGTEALQLTCRRFHFIILQNVDTLPTRLACDLRYSDGRVYLYRAIYMPDDETNDWHSRYAIADADADTDAANELQDMYQTFGR